MKLKEYLRTKPREFTFELYSDEEEHGVCTLEENPLLCFGLEFQKEWADIYDAEIINHAKPHGRNYEIIILGGPSAEDIERFIYICAGFVGAEYYDAHYIKEA